MKNDIVRILEENTHLLSLLKRIPLQNTHFRSKGLPDPPREAPVPLRGLKRPRGAPESSKEDPRELQGVLFQHAPSPRKP